MVTDAEERSKMKVLTVRTGFVDIPGMVTLDIYATGCSLRCPTCCNPRLQDFDPPGSYILKITHLTRKINEAEKLFDAVCWMGGEPLEQAEHLFDLIRSARMEFPDLPHLVFSGRTREEILDRHEMKEVFAIADAVKTGRWNGIPLGKPGCAQKIYCGNEEIPYDQLASHLRR